MIITSRSPVRCIRCPAATAKRSARTPAATPVIMGPVGVGKTFLATALGHAAIRRRFNVHFERCDRLLKRLRASRLDNSHDQEMRKLLRVDLLIVDDFALQPLDALDSRVLTRTAWVSHSRTCEAASNRCRAACRSSPLWSRTARNTVLEEFLLVGSTGRDGLQRDRAGVLPLFRGVDEFGYGLDHPQGVANVGLELDLGRCLAHDSAQQVGDVREPTDDRVVKLHLLEQQAVGRLRLFEHTEESLADDVLQRGDLTADCGGVVFDIDLGLSCGARISLNLVEYVQNLVRNVSKAWHLRTTLLIAFVTGLLSFVGGQLMAFGVGRLHSTPRSAD